MSKFSTTQIHTLLENNSEIHKWSTSGLDSLGRIFGSISPKNCEEYGVDGYWVIDDLTQAPRLALGFSMLFLDDIGNEVGRLYDSKTGQKSFKTLTADGYVENSMTKALEELEKDLIKLHDFKYLGLKPASMTDGELFGWIGNNTLISDIPWTYRRDGKAVLLPCDMAYGARAEFKDGNGNIWGGSNLYSEGMTKFFKPCFWQRDPGGKYQLKTIEQIDGVDWVCTSMSKVDEDHIIFTYQTKNQDRGFALFNTKGMKVIHRFDIPKPQVVGGLFAFDSDLNLYYTAYHQDRLDKIEAYFGSLIQGNHITLNEKLEGANGISDEDLEKALVRGCSNDGKVLLVRRYYDGKRLEKIWLLETRVSNS